MLKIKVRQGYQNKMVRIKRLLMKNKYPYKNQNAVIIRKAL